MTTALDAFVDAYQGRGVSRETLVSELENWNIVPVIERGEIIGAFAIKGNELHVGSKRPSASTRRVLREVFRGIIAEHGAVSTTVMEDNVRGYDMCLRAGFTEVSRGEGVIKLTCKGIPYDA